MNGTWELVYSLTTRLTHCCYICEMYTVRSFTPLFTGNTISLLSGEVIKTINTTTLITFLYYFFPLMTAWQNKRRFLWNPELYLNIYLPPPSPFHFSTACLVSFMTGKICIESLNLSGFYCATVKKMETTCCPRLWRDLCLDFILIIADCQFYFKQSIGIDVNNRKL